MDPEFTSNNDVEELTAGIGGLFVDTNDLKLKDNCYYCAVAGAKGLSVSGLVKDSGLMQIQGGASVADLAELIRTAGVGSGGCSQAFRTFAEASQHIQGHSILTFQHASAAHAIRVGWNGTAWAFVDDQDEALNAGYPGCFTTWGAYDFQIWPLSV